MAPGPRQFFCPGAFGPGVQLPGNIAHPAQGARREKIQPGTPSAWDATRRHQTLQRYSPPRSGSASGENPAWDAISLGRPDPRTAENALTAPARGPTSRASSMLAPLARSRSREGRAIARFARSRGPRASASARAERASSSRAQSGRSLPQSARFPQSWGRCCDVRSLGTCLVKEMGWCLLGEARFGVG